MGFRSKRPNPVDRAVADLERQIKTLERQIHQLDADGQAEPKPTPLDNVSEFVRKALAPPSKRKTVAPTRERRDLFDLPAAPLDELQIEHPGHYIAEPAGSTAAVTRPAAGADRKLAQYLSAGTFRGQKPILKHVQKRNQQQFYMWLGLAAAVLCVLYFIIR
jgi:hypothetical protein